MRIGVDFDNTIVSYDSLFHQVARERDLVPADVLPSKLAVRDHLRTMGLEDVWTEMQGHVYGARMEEARAYPGALEFFAWARMRGHELMIVSHKTRYPFAGPRHDLHAAARAWVAKFMMDAASPLIQGSRVFFEVTKAEKITRIKELALHVFIDDLPEILLDPSFPDETARLLFNPDGMPASSAVISFSGWHALREHVEAL
jgi:hypothetical protein